jgi:hypothetical protein
VKKLKPFNFMTLPQPKKRGCFYIRRWGVHDFDTCLLNYSVEYPEISADRVAMGLRLGLALLAGWLISGGGALAKEQQAPRARVSTALKILSHTPTGRALLKRAQEFWKISRPTELSSVFKWGEASKTDAILTRHFNSKTGEETRDRLVTIYLREDQSLDDLVLDMAHEIVHATTRPGWDPYDPKLTTGKYIWSAIEGKGGEVDAVAQECQVGFELLDRFGSVGASIERCQGYLSAGQLNRELIRRDFYRVGKWNQEISQNLGEEFALFPLMNSEAPTLFSSTGNAPYPVALYREFEDITRIACTNSRRRPASLTGGTAVFLAKRCVK